MKINASAIFEALLIIAAFVALALAVVFVLIAIWTGDERWGQSSAVMVVLAGGLGLSVAIIEDVL